MVFTAIDGRGAVLVQAIFLFPDGPFPFHANIAQVKSEWRNGRRASPGGEVTPTAGRRVQ